MLTSRPNADIGHRQFASKTPGRALSRAENAHRGPATVHGKGKNVLLQTPLNTGTKQLLTGTVAKPLRPLVDQTPFLNRAPIQFQTPFGGPAFDKTQQTPDSIQRPSSLRRHDRVPRSATKNFQTPANTMNPWECDISIGSPEALNQSVASLAEDDDDVEFTAPNTLDLPYAPPFDFTLPNYSKVGGTLRGIVRSPMYDDTPPPDPILRDQDALGITPWQDLVQLPELESSDPFQVMAKQLKPKTKALPTPKPPTARAPVNCTMPRARSVVSRPISKPVSRAPSRPPNSTTTSRPRPATAMSSRAPTTQKAPLKTTAVQRRPASVASRVVKAPGPKVATKDAVVFDVEKPGMDDFMFSV